MEIIGTVYTLRAVANRLDMTKQALKQAIYRLKTSGQELIIDGFRFVLVPGNGYIATSLNEDIIVIDE